MKNLTVSINRAEIPPSTPDSEPDPVIQTEELIVSIQHSKRALRPDDRIPAEPPDDSSGQQMELNGEEGEREVLKPVPAVDVSDTGGATTEALNSSHGEVGGALRDEPERDQPVNPTSIADSNQGMNQQAAPLENLGHVSTCEDVPSSSPSAEVVQPSISSPQFAVADDQQPSSSSSLQPSGPPSVELSSLTEEIQPSSYAQAVPTEQEQLPNSSPSTPPPSDDPQPSSSVQPMESQTSLQSPQQLNLQPSLSSPPNSTSLSESTMVEPQPDKDQEEDVTELIPAAASVVAPSIDLDREPQSSEATVPSESEQPPSSQESEEMEVSGEVTEQADVMETTAQEPAPLTPPDDVTESVPQEQEGEEQDSCDAKQKPDTSSDQEGVTLMNTEVSQTDKEAAMISPSSSPEQVTEDTVAPGRDGREPTSTSSELPTTSETIDDQLVPAPDAAQGHTQPEEQVVTGLTSAADSSPSLAQYEDTGKPPAVSSEDDSFLQGVVSSSGVEPAGIDADVVVPTVEEDDFSVFSAEAAEAQQLRASSKHGDQGKDSLKRRLSSGDKSAALVSRDRQARESFDQVASREERDADEAKVSL